MTNPLRRHHLSRALLPLAIMGFAAPALAFVGFVTISNTETVNLTIYNAADLTLVRDIRRTVFKKGVNALRYEWSGTRIDPTSLRPLPIPALDLLNTTYPLDHGEALVWQFKSDRDQGVSLPVQYFTSGLTWQASHLLKKKPGGKASLETWIKVQNNSGEVYDNAHISLVVGEVRLVETIRELADRFKNEAEGYLEPEAPMEADAAEPMLEMMDAAPMAVPAPSPGGGAGFATGATRAKEVIRETLSELHLYRIEGTESVPDAGARRMRAFTYPDIDVTDVYRCKDPGNNSAALRVITLDNTKENHMGAQPLPEGALHVYENRDGALSYQGRGNQKYTPMEETSETELGYAQDVSCRFLRKSIKRTNLMYDAFGRITGYDETIEGDLKLINGSSGPAAFELRQTYGDPFTHTLKDADKEDKNTLLFKHTLPAFQSKTWQYAVTVRKGARARKDD